MFNNSNKHSQAEIPLIKYSYHTDTQSLDTYCACVCARVCVPVVASSGPQLAVAQSSQKADDLDGFSQSHLISQDAACLLTVEFPHPAHTCLLVPDRVISASEQRGWTRVNSLQLHACCTNNSLQSLKSVTSFTQLSQT